MSRSCPAFPWNAPWRCCRITTTTGAPINSAEFPADQGHGYLWRLSNYWRLEEKEGGVYMQVESIALSRDVPAIFAWFVNPLIRRTSRQPLAHLLEATRRGLLGLGGAAARRGPPCRTQDPPGQFAISSVAMARRIAPTRASAKLLLLRFYCCCARTICGSGFPELSFVSVSSV